MPDLSVVRASLQSRFETAQSRCAELRAELDGLQAECDRLATTLGVLDEHLGPASASGPADSSEPVPLSARILDALGTTGVRRADLLRLFRPQGYGEAAIDSAVSRMKARGDVRRQGKLILRAGPSSELLEPVASTVATAGVADSGAAPSPESETPGGAAGDLSAAPVVAGSPPSAGVPGGAVADADERPLRHRVREAVAAGVDTRKELLAYFAVRGVRQSSLDYAIAGLKRRRVIERLPSGKLVMAPSDPAESGSRDP